MLGGEVLYWKQRDKKIIELIATWKCMSTNQIYKLLFHNINNGYSKASERLRSLIKQEKIRRKRVGREYIYYLGEWSAKWKHWHELCNYYVKTNLNLKSWEEMKFYQEFLVGFIIADGFMTIKNTVKCDMQKYFIEIDLATNPFDKVSNYNKLFEKKDWANQWWADLNNENIARFPRIVIATLRPNVVHKHIERENKNNLKFKVEGI